MGNPVFASVTLPEKCPFKSNEPLVVEWPKEVVVSKQEKTKRIVTIDLIS